MILDLAFVPIRGDICRFFTAKFTSAADAETAIGTAMGHPVETILSFPEVDGFGKSDGKIHIIRFTQIRRVIIQPYDPPERASLPVI
jgi:hypothetical protein